MEHPRYAVLLWAVTAGSQADSLGSDETDTVALGWSVLDLSNSKVILSQVDYVKPQTVDINDNVQLSDECRECNVTEENVREARSLEQVIEEFIGLIESRHDCNHPTDFQLITDGQLHLRQVLHPEAIRHRLQLPSCFFSFFDLRKQFSRFYNAESPNSIADILNYLSLEADGSAEFIPRQLQNMAQIVCRMLSDGHKFSEPETILRRLEPGLCSKSETIDSGCVARARGLPWQSSDQDIANFFRGLNIVKGGVALCLTAMGRRNGEALIRFESQEHRDLALKRHRHHIGQRYIEVYRANGEDFLNVAGCNNNEAQAFLSRGGQVIVRMRGLPYDCTAKQILDFFAQSDNPIQVLNNEDGILFVKKPDGRATGDAFVLFATEEAAYRALDKHREIIGARYIELFRSSTAEVQQVLNRTMETPYLESQVSPATTSPLLGNLPQVPLMPPPWLQGPQVQMARKDCIRLRGLPYEAQVEHIVDFLGKFATNIAYQGVHMVHNAQGQPSGEAFIQMDSEQSAFLSASQRHHRYLVIDKKQRYIEVFQCSLEDMLLVLQGVQGQPTPTTPVSALTAAPTPDLGWSSDPFGRISAIRSRIASLGQLPPLHLPPIYSKYPAAAAAAAAAASVAQSGPNRVSPTSALNRVSPLLLPSFPLPMLLSQAAPPQYYPTTTQQQQAAVAAAASLSQLVSQQNAYASLYTNTAQC